MPDLRLKLTIALRSESVRSAGDKEPLLMTPVQHAEDEEAFRRPGKLNYAFLKESMMGRTSGSPGKANTQQESVRVETSTSSFT